MKILSCLPILLLTCSTTLFAQSYKIVQQEFAGADIEHISIAGISENQVKVQYTEGNTLVIKVKAQIRISVKNEELINFLVDSDRYQLHTKKEGENVVLAVQENLEDIVLNDQKLKEYVSYTVYVPKNIREVAFLNNTERNPWQRVRQARKAPKYWVSK